MIISGDSHGPKTCGAGSLSLSELLEKEKGKRKGKKIIRECVTIPKRLGIAKAFFIPTNTKRDGKKSKKLKLRQKE